ncbi:MAG TPA: TetR/AcrR family transcriptional regulator [Ktedonobacterales bacterium]|nr:TetR/AcrR family transcriptional regulator [Ktedonobacterales bacterium]
MAQEAARDTGTGSPVTSLKERRRLYRQETIDAILATARSVMREQGVAALNLNEVARRLDVSGQALAKYFPNKAALYDELFLRGHRLFHEPEQIVLQTTAPDWGRIHQWFTVRLDLACEHPDLYSLIWGDSVPGYTHSTAVREEIGAMLAGARRGIGEVIESGAINAGVPPERVVDILMAVRHGIIAEHLAKRNLLPSGSDRFSGLIPDILAVFERAWAPTEQQSARAGENASLPAATSQEGGRSS